MQIHAVGHDLPNLLPLNVHETPLLPELPIDVVSLIFSTTATVGFSYKKREKRYRFLCHLKILSKKFQALAKLLELQSINTKHLKIENCIHLKINTDFAHVSNPYLEMCLHNKNKAMAYILSKKETLRVLDLRYFQKINLEDLKNILEAQPNLEALYVSHSEVTSDILQSLEKLSKLKHLQIMYVDVFGDEEIKKISDIHSHLESLYIQGEKITQLVVPILAKFTQLKKLIMQNCEHLNDEEVMKIIQNHPQLVTLNIVNSNISDVVLNEMRSLKNLKNVKIMNCKNIQTISILGNMTQLEGLTIGRCGSLRSFEFLNKLPNLKKFRMPWSTNLSEMCIFQIKNLTERGVELNLTIENIF